MSRSCAPCCSWTTRPVPDLGAAAPIGVALVAALVVAATIVIAVRANRRSPRARAAAEDAVALAAEALVRLDDAVENLDVAFEAVDALDAPDAPTELRRARTAAHRARDRGFADVAALDARPAIPARRRDDARRVAHDLNASRARVDALHVRLDEWTAANRSPTALREAARARRDDIVAATGDPEPLLAALRQRFDAPDWVDAQRAAEAAATALSDADAALRDADADPSLETLRRATAALRRAGRYGRAVEDAHRIVLQAAQNADDELAAVRDELDAALAIIATRPAQFAPSAAGAVREAVRELETAAAAAARRPREAVATVASVREVRDRALGDAVSARQRLDAARAALPGTLACARAALAAADARDDAPAIEDRLRLERARRELAAARAATDAEEALANARAAWHAIPPTRS